MLDKIRGEHGLKIRDTFFGDYEDLKRSYRKFAKEANDGIGEHDFGGLLPG